MFRLFLTQAVLQLTRFDFMVFSINSLKRTYGPIYFLNWEKIIYNIKIISQFKLSDKILDICIFW